MRIAVYDSDGNVLAAGAVCESCLTIDVDRDGTMARVEFEICPGVVFTADCVLLTEENRNDPSVAKFETLHIMQGDSVCFRPCGTHEPERPSIICHTHECQSEAAIQSREYHAHRMIWIDDQENGEE